MSWRRERSLHGRPLEPHLGDVPAFVPHASIVRRKAERRNWCRTIIMAPLYFVMAIVVIVTLVGTLAILLTLATPSALGA